MTTGITNGLIGGALGGDEGGVWVRLGLWSSSEESGMSGGGGTKFASVCCLV